MKSPPSMVAALVMALSLGVAAAHAESEPGYKAYSKAGKFEDVMFELQNAIINHGLVVDYTGRLNGMLERTSEVVGRGSPYVEANYLHFCSAKLTHGAVSADPLNIAICPYVVFIFETKSEPGKIHVGYRRPITDRSARSRQVLAKVEALLDEIVREAVK